MRNYAVWSVFSICLLTVSSSGLLAGELEKVAAEDSAQDWTSWRGPKGDSSVGLTGIRMDFSEGLPKKWEVKDLCKGKGTASWSAPSIKGKTLIVPGRHETEDITFALDAESGTLIWKKAYAAPGKPQYGTGPRAQPTIDGDHVYTFGAMGHLVCWKLADGEEVWRRNVTDEGAPLPVYGHSTAPLIVDDKVVVQCGGKTLIMAYNKLTGEVAWRSMKGKAAYAAPIRATLDGKDQILVFTAAGLAGLVPETGKLIWKRPWRTRADVNCTTPAILGDRIFITSSMGKGCQMLRAKDGAVKPVWTNKSVLSYHSDPIFIDKHLYIFSGHTWKGDLRCVELATGKVKWVYKKLGYGTMVLIDGHLLCLSDKGRLALIKPDPASCKVVSEFQAIDSKPVWTMPIVARGSLYIRYANRLICYALANTGKPTSKNVSASKPESGKNGALPQ